jgi:hypothetical protein
MQSQANSFHFAGAVTCARRHRQKNGPALAGPKGRKTEKN